MLEEVICKAEKQVTISPYICSCTIIRYGKVQICIKPSTCFGRIVRLRKYCKHVAWRLAA